VRPSGCEYQPGQKFGIIGQGSSDLNIHHHSFFGVLQLNHKKYHGLKFFGIFKKITDKTF
jgi:hypothetical protein